MEIEVANRTKDVLDLFSEVYSKIHLYDHIASRIGAGQIIIQGSFTVQDWVYPGKTTINGGEIETGTVTLTTLNFTPLSSSSSTDDIIATINASAEGIRIDADKIILAGTVAVDKDIQSSNYVAATSGWIIDGNGDAELNSVTVRGAIYATSGEFTGTLKTTTIETGKTLTVSGTISAAGGEVKMTSAGFYIYDGATLRGKVGKYSTGVFMEGYPDSYLKSSAGTYWVGVQSDQFYIRAHTYINADFDPVGEAGYWQGDSTHYWDRLYTENIYRTHELNLQHHDDIGLICAMKEDPKKHGYIDKSTIPSILRRPVAETRAEMKTRRTTDHDRLMQELDKANLSKSEKARIKNERMAEYQTEMAVIDSASDDELCDIDAFAEISLAFGAIRQMAARLDAVEAKL
jgi:hypothetical protein